MIEADSKCRVLPGLLVWSFLGAAAAAAGTNALPTAAEVQKTYGDLMRAKHQLASDSDQFLPADAARFEVGLDGAVALYTHQADDKSAATGLTYMFAYCEHPPASVAVKCRHLKTQGHALVLERFIDSRELIGFLMHSTGADLPFVEAVFDKATLYKSHAAERAGELWLARYTDEKTTLQGRQTAGRMVLKYGHALEQDNTVTEWGQKPIAMNHLKGEGLVNGVEAEGFGKVLPDFGWLTFSDEKVSLQQHRGEILLLDFWATWCVPCVASMPHIDELRRELAGKPFEVISINAQGGNIKDIVEFQSRKVSMPWTNWRVHPDSEDYFRIGITELPTYFVLDENGRVLYRAGHFGAELEQHIRKAVAALSKS